MMRVDSLSAKADSVGLYKVNFSDGSVMRLYRQTVEDFGLYVGLELSEVDMQSLRHCAGEMSAKMRAVRIVAASTVSKNDLQRRLIMKGESPDQAQKAVQWMEELSLVDDKETARQLVQRCISRGYGLSRAKQVLYEKRVPKEFWKDALEDYPDQQEKIRAFLLGRIVKRSDNKEIKKAVDSLLRKGHSYSTIRTVLNEILEDTDPFTEDY